MHLNEIIENNTLEQISKRTRLTHENLEKLFAGDFKDFTKVQAFGFISILEREYRADLSSLREKCTAYFSDGVLPAKTKKEQNPYNQPADESPIVAPMNIPKQAPKYLKPTIIALVAVGLLYAAWQTFASSMQTSKAASDQEQNAGFFSSMANQTKNLMGSDENKTDTDVKVASKDQKAWADKKDTNKNTFVITNKANAKSAANTNNKKADEENEIIKNVKAQQAKAQQAKKPNTKDIEVIDNAIADANNADTKNALSPEVPSISTGTVTKKQSVEKTAQQEEAAKQKIRDDLARKRAMEAAARQKAAQKAQAEKIAQEKLARQNAAAEKARKQKIARQKAAKEKAAKIKAAKEAARKKALAAKAAKIKAAKEKAAKIKAAKIKAAKIKAAKNKAIKEKLAQQKAAKDKAAKEKAVKNARFVIKPSKSIWLGIVDLRTMKRKTYNGTGVAAFSNPKGRWIVATSHGHFSFRAGNRVVRFNNNSKHYLIIQNGNIHEIPHATFQKLNQSKAW